MRWASSACKESPVFEDIGLAARCVQIIRGELPGREPRADGFGQFPACGQARVDDAWLIWSGPFSFDLDLRFGHYVPLPGICDVYVAARQLGPSPSGYPPPRLCLIVGETQTWATLWPSMKLTLTGGRDV